MCDANRAFNFILVAMHSERKSLRRTKLNKIQRDNTEVESIALKILTGCATISHNIL